jgi:hypothetical protein
MRAPITKLPAERLIANVDSFWTDPSALHIDIPERITNRRQL